MEKSISRRRKAKNTAKGRREQRVISRKADEGCSQWCCGPCRKQRHKSLSEKDDMVIDYSKE